MASDDQLIQQFLNGQSRAFAELYARHERQLFAYVSAWADCREEAEDLFQEIFIRCLRGLKGYKGRGRFKAYLFSLARNHLANAHRNKTVRQIGAKHWPLIHMEHLADNHAEELEEVNAKLSSLPANQREVFLLHIMEEMTFVEIADLLAVPLDAVVSRYRYALEKLRVVLRKD